MRMTGCGFVWLLLLLNACTFEKPGKDMASAEDQQVDYDYAFFAAGHVYGNPMEHQYGLYPEFDKYLDDLNAYPKMAFGVLTGDVVAKPTHPYFDSLIADMVKLNMPWYLAPGNHDRGNEFEKRFEQYYQKFYHKKDLFILLSPEQWKIEGEQLAFLSGAIQNTNDSTQNIFIFLHELIWWSPEGEFKDIKINYQPHYPGSTNWQTVDSVLHLTNKPVYLVAGDVGVGDKEETYFHHHYDHIHLMASGMGLGEKDNIVIFEVGKSGSVKFKFLSLSNNLKPL